MKEYVVNNCVYCEKELNTNNKFKVCASCELIINKLGDYDYTKNQLIILKELFLNHSDYYVNITQKELSEKTCLSLSLVNNVMSELMEMGFISKVHNGFYKININNKTKEYRNNKAIKNKDKMSELINNSSLIIEKATNDINYEEYDKEFSFNCDYEVFSNDKNKIINEITDLKPIGIKKILDKHVVGQEEAKKMISVAIYSHYKKHEFKEYNNKNNVLIVGPTGSGKTHIIQTISNEFNLPLNIIDATTLTEAGYVGKDVEDIIKELYVKSDYSKELTELGIVYIDEIDKISAKGTSHNTEDIGGVGVQESLLKLMEGTEIPMDDIDTGSFGYDIIDTSNILFICGGAFSNIDKVNKENNNAIGFNINKDSSDTNTKKQQTNTRIESKDIVDYGFIPEFVGRLPVLIELNELKKEDLINILINIENSLINEYIKWFESDGIKIEFTDDAIEYIAEEALSKEFGVRSLSSIIEDKMYKLMFEAPSYQNKDKPIVINKDYLTK